WQIDSHDPLKFRSIQSEEYSDHLPPKTTWAACQSSRAQLRSRRVPKNGASHPPNWLNQAARQTLSTHDQDIGPKSKKNA
ncbi:MAG: hypothetical protein OXC60_05380, partial [Litoreibacter sp.]|nr:hypothetical protein [Litoreibacter sp.]